MKMKLYSKKTLRVALHDLEEQNRVLRANRDSLERALSATEDARDSARSAYDALVQRTSVVDNDAARIEANARIVSPKVLHDFQQWRRQNPDEDFIQNIKELRTLTRNEAGEMCGLREARDLVDLLRDRDIH